MDALTTLTLHQRSRKSQEKKPTPPTDTAIAKGNKNRTENAIQKRRGVDKTSAMPGQLHYGKLKKDLHMKDLEVELLHRGCSTEQVKAMTGIRERLNELKDMEAALGNYSSADKGFRPQSGASFKVA